MNAPTRTRVLVVGLMPAQAHRLAAIIGPDVDLRTQTAEECLRRDPPRADFVVVGRHVAHKAIHRLRAHFRDVRLVPTSSPQSIATFIAARRQGGAA